MLITDDYSWDAYAFESAIEGMCSQLKEIPSERIAFWGKNRPEVVFLFFALWKLKKIACPLNTRLPSYQEATARLGATFFEPSLPTLQPPTPWHVEENTLATMLFTSGSSGLPKIAVHTFGNHLYNALGSQALTPLSPSDCWHLSIPLFHVGGIGIIVRCYLARCSISLCTTPYTATHLSLVPTQLFRLLQHKTPLPRLKTLLLGGAPCPFPLENISLPVVPTYGMTETSSQIATGGKILPHCQVKITPDHEIVVKGKTLFQGYLTPEGGLDLPLDEEGWFHTNDLGKWNSEGKLEVTGRKDNLFISGGENIQPEEIELLLKRHLAVEEAVVIPKPDVEFGMRPIAFLRPLCSLEEVRKALLPLVPKYKIPLEVLPLPEETGLKIDRKKIRPLA